MEKNKNNKYREFLEKKEKKRQLFLNKRYKKACSDFKRIINTIITDYQPARIYQWGSLLNREHFSEMSDIDVAVEGIKSAEDIFKLFGEIMDLTDFHVDIVELDKIEPEYADIIKAKGRLVYERGQ